MHHSFIASSSFSSDTLWACSLRFLLPVVLSTCRAGCGRALGVGVQISGQKYGRLIKWPDWASDGHHCITLDPQCIGNFCANSVQMIVNGPVCSFKWTSSNVWMYFYTSMWHPAARMLRCSEWLTLGVSRYTGIDDNRDIQSNNYQYRVNLVCDDIPVLAITTIVKMNRTLMITCKYSSASTWLTSRWQYCTLILTPVKQEEEQRSQQLLREELCSSE